MSLEQQIQETVSMAKERSLTAFKKFSEDGDAEYQSKEESDRILAQHKWLCERFTQVAINGPGMRTRMGWTPEALEALAKEFK